MGNSGNPLETKITNSLLRYIFIEIAMVIPKEWCLASYLFYLFFERNEFLEPTLCYGELKLISK